MGGERERVVGVKTAEVDSSQTLASTWPRRPV